MTLHIPYGVFLAALLCASFAVVGCGSHTTLQYAPCIKENQKDLRIRWGTRNDSLNTADYYELDARGALTHVTSDHGDSSRRELNPIPHETYCATVDQVTRVFVKVQALHSPGTKARYVEYANPQTSVFLRAVWNPDLSTFQSRDMRAQFDSLMTLVPGL